MLTHLQRMRFQLRLLYVQCCPDIIPLLVQPDNGAIPGVGFKTVKSPTHRIYFYKAHLSSYLTKSVYELIE